MQDYCIEKYGEKGVFSEILILTHQDYSSHVERDLDSLDIDSVPNRIKLILETEKKNTAPAITLASEYLIESGDPIMLILPADHVIEDEKKFNKTIDEGISIAKSGGLVTFGIKPTSPNTGYGYIKKGCKKKNNSIYEIDEFREKPDKETAQQFIESGQYCWNSGIFLFKASSFLKELKNYYPDIIDNCEITGTSESCPQSININSKKFSKCRAISIDKSLMEKTKLAYVVELECDWTDIGSWNAFWERENKNGAINNRITSNVITENTKDCLIISDRKLIATSSVEDLVIVDTSDALLVANKNDTKSLTKLIKKLQSLGRNELMLCEEDFKSEKEKL